jgi:nicotinamide-nucleotide amidase
VRSVELLTIGTELLLGFTVDTNGAYLGQQLSAIGVQVARRTSVADRPDQIRAAVDEALRRTGAVITTGGLGPTRDDMSKVVVADLLGLPLEFSDDVWSQVLARYARFGRKPVESNRSQAMVPRGAVALPNQWGTAPGLWIESNRGLVIMLPGVPLEMRMLLEHELVPRLRERSDGSAVVSRTLRTCGIPESTLAERIHDIEDGLGPLTLAYLPSVAGVDLRLTVWDMPRDTAVQALDAIATALRERVFEHVYGEATEDLAAVVLDRLRRTRRTLAVAESCTGGLLGGRITAIPGSSDVFVGGVVAYDNRIKQELLGVDPALIVAHGAVSSQVAAAMAAGAVARCGAEVAIAITGVAGPGGGTAEKPVGTAWVGLHAGGEVVTHRSVFGGDRDEIRARAVQGALLALWRHLRTNA